MKKVLALAVFMISMSAVSFGQFKFGAGAVLATGSGGNVGVQAKGHYQINEDFAGQASFTYFFESDVTFTHFDLDVHYSGFDLGDVEGFSLTPFAGLNIATVSASSNGFGASFTDTNINVGVNGTFPITDSMDLYIEPKIVIGGGFIVGAGVYF